MIGFALANLILAIVALGGLFAVVRFATIVADDAGTRLPRSSERARAGAPVDARSPIAAR